MIVESLLRLKIFAQNHHGDEGPDATGGHQAALGAGHQRDGVQHGGQGQDDPRTGLVHEVQSDAFPVHEWWSLLSLL